MALLFARTRLLTGVQQVAGGTQLRAGLVDRLHGGGLGLGRLFERRNDRRLDTRQRGECPVKDCLSDGVPSCPCPCPYDSFAIAKGK